MTYFVIMADANGTKRLDLRCNRAIRTHLDGIGAHDAPLVLGRKRLSLKKPVLVLEEASPIKPSRADLPPTDGFLLVVDGHFKTWFASIGAAEEAARVLKTKFQMLKVQTYDASAKIWSATF